MRAQAAALPPILRDALDAAFGLPDGPAPERFLVALAVIDLVSEVAAEAPFLVLAEDAH